MIKALTPVISQLKKSYSIRNNPNSGHSGVWMFLLCTVFSVFTLATSYSQSITLSKTASNPTPDVEEVFNYVLDLSCSSSTGPCSGVVIRDTLPGFVEFLNFSSPLPSGIASATFDVSTREALIIFDNNVPAGSSIQLNVQVQFPYGTITGSSAVNTAYATSVDAGSDISSATATAQNGMVAGDFPDDKSGDGDMISGGYQYWSVEVGNIGFTDIDNYTIIDTIPPGFTIDQVRSPHFTDVDHSGDIYYMASNSPGVWILWYNFNMDTRERRDVSGLGLLPGVTITQLRLDLGTVSASGLYNPYIYPNTFERNWTIYGIEDGSYNVGDTYTNCAYYSGTSGGSSIRDVSCRTTDLVAPTNEVIGGVDALDLSGADQSTFSIGDTMIVAVIYASPTLMGNNLVGGVMTAILPPNVNYVPGSWYYAWGVSDTDGHNPAVETGVTLDGREILRFVYDSTVYNNAFNIEPTGTWEGFRIDFKAFVDPAAIEGSYDIEYYFNATEMNPDNCGANDVDNYLNGFASTFCQEDASMNIVRPPGSAGLDSRMEVIGTLDTDYSQYPDRALTVPGGITDYRITIKNPNAKRINELVFVTVLPHIGDTEILDTGMPRFSEWQPALAQVVSSLPLGLSVEYSTVSNPCRDDLAGSNPIPFPTGCTTAGWSSTPPLDITDVTALRFDYGNTILNQDDSLVVYFAMRSPVDGLPDTSIAWNSFGYSARNFDDNIDLLPAEPIKVGIELRPGNTPILGDFVWEDLEPNGRQDLGEVGIDGVRVELYHDVDADGIAEPSGPDTLELWTVTSGGGKYLFSDFDYGRYFVVFSDLPTGYNPTFQDAVNDSLDSDGLISPVRLFDNTIIDYNHDLGLYNGVLPVAEDCTNGIDDDGDGLVDCNDPDCGVTTIEYYNYQKAFAVVGQDDFISSNQGVAPDKFNSVRDVLIDPVSNKVFVADGLNNRVLRYASFDDFLNNRDAEAALGQPDLVSNSLGTSQTTMDNPNGLAIANNGDLFVSEYDNNRILKFANGATIPTGSPADVVLGQPDFTTQPNGRTQTKMWRPYELIIEDDNTLWVADGWNGRVLRFDNATTLGNGAPADGVLGQTNYTAHVITVDAIHIDQTTGLAMVNGILFVGDYQANRVLIWENAKNLPNGSPADRVLGQPDFSSDTSPIDNRHVGGITDLDIDPSNNLFVQDIWQDRTTIFYDAPNLKTYDTAQIILHQPDFTTILGGTNVTQRKSYNPNGIRYTRQGYVNYLVEGEQGGHRVMLMRPAIETDEVTSIRDTLPGRDLSDQNSAVFQIVTQTAQGTVTLDDSATGEFTYVPPGLCPIDVDTSYTFLYSIANVYGCIDTAEMLIFVDDVGTCIEICNDNIDNDLNGLLDCLDGQCITAVGLNDPSDTCIDGTDLSFIGTPTDANGSYSTSAGSGLTDNGDGTASFDISDAGAGTFDVTYSYTNTGGCTFDTTVSVTIYALPVVELNDPSDACVDGSDLSFIGSPSNANGSFITTAGGGLTDNGDGTATLDVSTAGSGTYDVTYSYTDVNSCTADSTVSVTINAIPGVALSLGTDLACSTDNSIALTGGSPSGVGGSYNGTGVSGFTFNAVTAGVGPHIITYTYTDGNSCVNTATDIIVVHETPVITNVTGVNPTDCDIPDGTVTVTTTGGSGTTEYRLNGGTWQSSNIFSALAPGNYNVDVRNDNGTCIVTYASNPVNLGQPNSPNANIQLPSSECVGTTVSITAQNAGGGAAYSWDFGADATPPTANTRGPHNVTYSTSGSKSIGLTVVRKGCTAVDNRVYEVYALPTVGLNDPVGACVDAGAVAFTGTPTNSNGSFSTTALSGLTDNGNGTASLNVGTAGVGTYDVSYSYTDGNGCSNDTIISIQVFPLPTIFLNDPTDVCSNESDMNFIGFPTDNNGSFSTSASSGLIDNGDGTALLDVSVAGGGVYDVIYHYTDGNNCTNTDTVSVEIFDTPSVSAGSNQSICEGSNTTLSSTVSGGDGSYTYTWSPSTGLSSISIPNPTASPTSTITYTLTVEDGIGCVESNNVIITVDENPEVTMVASVPCAGETLTITSTAFNGAGSYLYSWTGPNGFSSNSPNAVVANFQVVNEGTYQLIVTDGSLCTTAQSVVVYLCEDFDNDNVRNSIDIDDDNDGITDVLECTSTGPNLLVNGDFEEAYRYWTSDFNRGRNNNGPTSDGCSSQGWVAISPCASETGICNQYYSYNGGTPTGSTVITDAYGTGDNVIPTTNCNTNDSRCLAQILPDHTTGTGLSLYVDPSDIPGKSYWKQTVTVAASTDYKFSAWIMVIEEDPNLVFKIDGVSITNDFNLDRLTGGSNGPDTWQEVATIWSSGTVTGSVVIELVNNTAGCAGNDIRLDDVFFSVVMCDCDGDGENNFMDLDSDNDGIYDAVEAGHSESVDADGRITGSDTGSGPNGLFDPLETGLESSILNYVPKDSEEIPDGIIDACELDSDGDGCYDTNEAQIDDGDQDGIAGIGSPAVNTMGAVFGTPYLATPNTRWQDYSINECQICKTAVTNPHVMYFRRN